MRISGILTEEEFNEKKEEFKNVIKCNCKTCLYDIYDSWGKVPICNKRPERALHIGTFCFPLCWRCTCICGSFVVTTFLLKEIHLEEVITVEIKNCIASLVLIMPTLIDAILQYYFDKESTNGRRIVTGIMAGLGLGIIYVVAQKYII